MDESQPSIWSSFRARLTPPLLFLLLNLLVVATVALTRRRRHQGHVDQSRTPLARASSSANVLDRLRSLGLFRFPSGDYFANPSPLPESEPDMALSDPPETRAEEDQRDRHQYGRSRSETARSPVAAAAAAEEEEEEKEAGRTMKKAASGKEKRVVRRPAARRAVAVEEEVEVDARADDFIKGFREQLKLQRLDSILRYKEMLNGGK